MVNARRAKPATGRAPSASTAAPSHIWTCTECSRAYNQSKGLERHARETQHKAYKCVCSRTFTRRTAAIRHNRSHAIGKPHACRACQKSFHRKDHCLEHEERCKGEKLSAGHQNPGAADSLANEKADDSETLSESSIAHLSDEMRDRPYFPNPDIPFSVHYPPKPNLATNPIDTQLLEALRNDALDNDAFQKLLHQGADVNAVHDFSGPRPLHIASSYSSPTTVQLLISAGANVNATDLAGRTPLHIASLKGRASVVRCLLSHGAHHSCVDKHYRTPLHVAALRGHLEAAKVLKEAGADVDALDNWDRTPYMMAACNSHKAVTALLLEEDFVAMQRAAGNFGERSWK